MNKDKLDLQAEVPEEAPALPVPAEEGLQTPEDVDNFLTSLVGKGAYRQAGVASAKRQHIEAARGRLQERGQLDTWGDYFKSQSVPVGSFFWNLAQENLVRDAKERVKKGEATEKDYERIAGEEARQETIKNRSGLAQVGAAAAQVPALYGEAMATGGLGLAKGAWYTKAGLKALQGMLMPSISLTPGVERVRQSPERPMYDPRNWVTPLGMAAVQNLAMGTAMHWANGIQQPVMRYLTSIGAGAAELEAFNIAGGALDEYLPETYQTRTAYGLWGDIFKRQDYDSAMVRAGQHVVTLGALQILNGNGNARAKEVRQKAEKILKEQAKKGAGEDTAAAELNKQMAEAYGEEYLSLLENEQRYQQAYERNEAGRRDQAAEVSGRQQAAAEYFPEIESLRGQQERQAAQAEFGQRFGAEEQLRRAELGDYEQEMVGQTQERMQGQSWEEAAGLQQKWQRFLDRVPDEKVEPWLVKRGLPENMVRAVTDLELAERGHDASRAGERVGREMEPGGYFNPARPAEEAAYAGHPMLRRGTQESPAAPPAAEPAESRPPAPQEMPGAARTTEAPRVPNPVETARLVEGAKDQMADIQQIKDEMASLEAQKASIEEKAAKQGWSGRQRAGKLAAVQRALNKLKTSFDEMMADPSGAVDWGDRVEEGLLAGYQQLKRLFGNQALPRMIQKLNLSPEDQQRLFTAAQLTPQEVADVNAELRRAGLAPLGPEAVAAAQEQGAAEALLAAADSALGPGGGAGGGGGLDAPGPRRIIEHAARDLADADGQPTRFEQHLGSMQRAPRILKDNYDMVASRALPKTVRANPAAANAAARRASHRTIVDQAVPLVLDEVLGEGWTPQDSLYYGTVATEFRFRTAKEKALAKASRLEAEAQSVAPAVMSDQAQRTRDINRLRAFAENTPTVVGGKGSLLANEADYQRGLKVLEQSRARYRSGVVQNWMEPVYRTTKGLAEDAEIHTLTQADQEPYTFVPVTNKGTTEPGTVGVRRGGGTSLRNLRNVENPLLKKAGFDADAYDMRLDKMVERFFHDGYKAKLDVDMDKAWFDAGLAKAGGGKDLEGFEPIPSHKVPKNIPLTPEQKKLNVNGQLGWYVRKDLLHDYLGVRNAGLPPSDIQEVIQLANLVPVVSALASTVELASHGTAQMAPVIKGEVPWGVFLHRLYQKIWDKPALRKTLLDVSMAGAGKAHHGLESEGLFPFGKAGQMVGAGDLLKPLEKVDPLRATGKILDHLSDVVRASLHDTWKLAVEAGELPNTQESLRDFIASRAGQYNAGLQHPVVRWLRQTGIGAFATAASTNTTASVTRIWGGAGTPATSNKAAVTYAARNLAKTAALLAGVAVWNYARHGSPLGSENTPLGSLYLGKDDQGREKSFDMLNIIGLKRGLRTVGVLPFLEGLRGEEPLAKQADKAATGMVMSMLHPFMGPLPEFAYEAFTGEDPRGVPIAKVADIDQSQRWMNVKAAAGHLSPLVEAGMGQKSRYEPEPWNERLAHLWGPWGFKYRDDRPAELQAFHQLMRTADAMNREVTLEARAKGLKPERDERQVAYGRLRQIAQKIADLERKLNQPGLSEADRKSWRESQREWAKQALKDWRAAGKRAG